MNDEFRKVRRQSNRFALLLMLEIGFCAMLFFVFARFSIESKYLLLYFPLLIGVPLAVNLTWYLRSRKRSDALGRHYAVIAQVIVWIFVSWYLLRP